MSRIDTHTFGLWWRLAKGWLSTKFASIDIDLTPVEVGIADVKTDVAGVKTAVENIDFTPVEESIKNLDEKISPYLYDECSVEDIERMFSSITENGYIIVPSSIIKQDGTIPLNLFVSITGLTPVLNDDENPVEPIIDENGRIVLPTSAFSSDGTMSISLFQQLTGLRLV